MRKLLLASVASLALCSSAFAQIVPPVISYSGGGSGSGGGTGDFTGPGASVDSDFVQFNGTTGKIGKDGGYSPLSFAPNGTVTWLTSADPTVDVTAWSKNAWYVVTTVARTFMLPVSTTLSNNGGIIVDAQEAGGTVTVTSPDTVTYLGVTSGAGGSATLSKGAVYFVTTDGVGHVRVSNLPALSAKNTWANQQANCITTLTAVSNVFTPDGSCNNYKLTLGATNTLANFSTMTPGAAGTIEADQDATGSRTIGTWGSQLIAPGGTASVALSTAANAKDLLSYLVLDSTHVWVQVGGLNASH